jgi:signal transduction histidine kinase
VTAAVRWWRRATGSVRLRVAAISAITFAVALIGGALVLLRTLEDRLVDDVRDADERALAIQAARVLANGVQRGQAAVSIADGESFVVALPPVGAQRVIARFEGTFPDTATDTVTSTAPGSPSAGLFIDEVVRSGGGTVERVEVPVDAESAELLGIDSSAGPFIVSTLPVAGGVTLATASTLAQVERTLDTTRTILWFAIPGLVMLVGALAWLVVGRALRPVHAVTSRVAAIGSDSLHERVPVPVVADEVGELATTMNSMLERLEAATVTSRRLVSDASHELRTPITVMRTELEVARQDPTADWQQVSGGVLAEVDRLQALVDDLLLLERGRADAPLVVDDIVRDVTARRRRVPVTTSLEGDDDSLPGIELVGDADAVGRALDHVVANAARHADGAVVVDVELVDGHGGSAAAIHVDDDGPGIPPSDRERVLERFVRLDEARSRDAGGSGLGLAVVADVMAAHGGHVRITDSPLGGARVTLLFPRPSPPPRF